MLNYIYHKTSKVLWNRAWGGGGRVACKSSRFCHLHLTLATFHNVIKICKPLVVYQISYIALYHSQTRRPVINLYNINMG